MKRFRLWTGAAMLCVACAGWAQEPAPEAPPEIPAQAAPSAEVPSAESLASQAVDAVAGDMPAAQALTLGDMIEAGGVVLWVIIGLSVIGFMMGLYFFFTVTVNREVPAQLVERAYKQIQAGDIRGAYQMCEGRDELMANVLRAGLKMAGHERYVIQEAMESEGERGATALWQRISYLNNIGQIAPLLGLLGTVWGMIQAFSSIALDDAKVKGLHMAESVAQAMITTAAGLMLAIPAMLTYYYLRGRVIKIIASVESHASELMELVSRRP